MYIHTTRESSQQERKKEREREEKPKHEEALMVTDCILSIHERITLVIHIHILDTTY